VASLTGMTEEAAEKSGLVSAKFLRGY